MKAQVEVEMVLVRFVRTGAENGGEIAAGAGPKALQGDRQRSCEGGVADSDPAVIRQFEANDIDGIAAAMLAELVGVVAIAVAAYETGAGSDGGEGQRH